MDVLPKTFLQIILVAKWPTQHSCTSPRQQRRTLPSLLSDYFSMRKSPLCISYSSYRPCAFHHILHVVLVHFILFFKSWCKIVCGPWNWIKSAPQAAVSIFAFSSVFILLLWLMPCILYIARSTYSDRAGWLRARDKLQGDGRGDEQGQAHHQLCLPAGWVHGNKHISWPEYIKIFGKTS